MKTLRTAAISLMLAGAVTACASGGGGEPGDVTEADGVAVQVENTTVPPTTLVVYMVPQTGTRQMLGTVDPNASRTFSFDVVLDPERYRLVAETTAGAELVSRPFSVTEGATSVTWDVELNTIRVQ